MINKQIESKHVFFLLLLFWVAWLYTEVTEYYSRDTFTAEVTEFMYRGDRFTKDDGDALKMKILSLEEQLSEIKGEE